MLRVWVHAVVSEHLGDVGTCRGVIIVLKWRDSHIFLAPTFVQKILYPGGEVGFFFNPCMHEAGSYITFSHTCTRQTHVYLFA